MFLLALFNKEICGEKSLCYNCNFLFLYFKYNSYLLTAATYKINNYINKKNYDILHKYILYLILQQNLL